VITGTGRTGTTFLVMLLTELGLDTGFKPGEFDVAYSPVGRAGLEHDVRRDDCPYVVKSPRFCGHASAVLARDDIAIDHVFIPMRDLHAAAESRRRVATVAAALAEVRGKATAPGGLWRTRSAAPGDQEEALLLALYDLLLALSDTGIPVTLIRYPRLVTDSAYLYEKLKPIVGDVSYDDFEAAHRRTARPDLVTGYNPKDG
jgi:hypothetical protein